METARLLGPFAAICAFAGAALLFPVAVARVGEMRRAIRAHDAALSGDGAGARLLRNGIAPANVLAAALCRHKKVGAYCDDIRWLAQSRGYETTAINVGGVMLAGALLILVLGGLMSGSALFGAMAAVCLVMGFGMAARQGRERQRDAMREEVPDVLHAMSACFHAGYSLMQAFSHIASETTGPLRQLFVRAQSDLATGSSASEALRRMREESDLPELAFVTAALEIQHQTGGSLQQIIDSACDSVEGELALRRSLRVQTAQARLSMRVVTVMPFVLIALFSFISPEFLSPFFATPLGMAVFAFAIGMQAAGVFCVRRLLDIKED